MGHTGKRAGPKRKRRFQPELLLLAVGVTAAVVAWGYLVRAAIDFGTTARAGESSAWWFLGLASLGAVACLFVGLMLVARLLRRLGITTPSATPATPPPTAPAESRGDGPRSWGGHRAAPLMRPSRRRPRGAEPVAPPLVLPGPPAGVEAADEVR